MHYGELAELFIKSYGRDAEARRQIGLLFALLPAEHQPVDALDRLATTTIMKEATVVDSPPRILTEDLAALLPSEFQCARIKGTQSFTIDPTISLYEVGVDEEFGQTAIGTTFGPLSSTPLKRGLPDYTPNIYVAFGISGGAGCVLTHTVVIPLDVVKTRIQTDPEVSGGLLQGAASIVEREGIEGLLLGAQATIAGYLWCVLEILKFFRSKIVLPSVLCGTSLWVNSFLLFACRYGVSVYPCYTFFKRLIGLSLLPSEIATVHMNDVALVAGALASVVASLGLTPLEACRIRTVADPKRYRPIGLLGTLRVISNEDPSLGWRALYAGLPSLLTRQVIFGSVKFLAFEQTVETIFKVWPSLQDATWTSLSVSLVAGGVSGALSSIVSQPADSVLTYVAQNTSGSLGVFEGCRIMVEKDGIGSLFRGLGSRCVWATAIIAGQFLLYDVFRTYFGVNGEDLTQVFELVIPTQ
jgi:solute carrier family 25 phosphate transporter 3